jgi:hypothetical protein
VNGGNPPPPDTVMRIAKYVLPHTMYTTIKWNTAIGVNGLSLFMGYLLIYW